MKVWILARKENFDNHENSSFRREAEKMGIVPESVASEDFDIIVTKEGRKSIRHNGNPVELPDCLIPRSGSSTTYFALAIIRHLERLGVFVMNSSQSIETAKDKLATMQFLASSNIPIPKTMLAKFPLNLEFVEKEFTFPLIIKTVSGTHGKGILLCERKEQLSDIADLIEVAGDPKVNVIIQEFVSSSKGKDIRVIVVGGRVLGAMMRRAKNGGFKANYSVGADVEPYEPSSAVKWLAIESARLIELDIAGVDILFDGESYKVCEVNSSPGFQGFEKATGVNVPREIYNYLKVRLEGSM